MSHQTLHTTIREKRIALTMGPGGVGKTTVAAAMGLQAAVEGRKALVLTIDPALRLADALGLSHIQPGDQHEISLDTLTDSGVPARSPLTVAMLDTQRAWQELLGRESSDQEQRQTILSHPFFKRMSDDLAGAREYAAMEELYHLYLHGGFDLLILDTPPTVHGVDFLEAPDRLLSVLDHDSYRWLMRPALLAGKLGLSVLNFSGGYVIRKLSRFTGLDFLKELANFVDLFSGLLEGFRQRATAVKSTLRSPVTSFVLVTSADPSLIQESSYLFRRLLHRDLRPETVVVNRVTPRPRPLPDKANWQTELLDDLISASDSSSAARENFSQLAQAVIKAIQHSHSIVEAMAERDASHIENLGAAMSNCCQIEPVPLLTEDIHDLKGLELLRRALFERGRK